jgi:hypothetical protein
LFSVATRSPSTEASSRGFVATKRSFLRFNAGRCWTNPFIWKDFHFVAGGIYTVTQRMVYYLAVVTLAYWCTVLFEMNFNDCVELCLVWIGLSLPIDAALLIARSMHDEVRAQTLSPLSNGIVYAKVGGSLLGWFPGPIVGLCVLLGTNLGHGWVVHWFSHEEGWLIPLVVLYFTLVPNFAALAALYVRWGAVPLAIGLTIGAYFAVMIVAVMWESLLGHYDVGFAAVISLLTVVLLLINLAVHIGVLFRFQALSER